MTYAFSLRASAEAFPDHPAISVGSSTFTYRDVWQTAQTTARWLSAHGVQPATKLVAIEPRKDVDSVITLWTLISLRVPFVLLHPSWSEVQTALVLQQTQAHKVPVAPIAGAPLREAPASNAYEYLERARQPRATTNDPLCVIYTSGTTGSPKGVILSHRAFLASAREATRWLRFCPDDAWLLSLPLAHVGGMSVLLRCWYNHARVALPQSDGKFTAHTFVRACTESKATFVSLVPTQLQRICEAGLQAPSSLRGVLLGGAASPAPLVQRASRLGYRVARTYGLTELCSMVATDVFPPTDATSSTATDDALPLHSHVEAQVSANGRLLLRGDALFSGYWGHDEHNATEWFATEDLAEIDGGLVRVLGRADDVIVTGGENVHPQGVEQALLGCPGIEQACVFGRPSHEWGQEVCAALVVSPGFSLNDAVSHLRRCVPSFTIPRAWVVVQGLPANANGKIQRSQVASELGPLCQSL